MGPFKPLFFSSWLFKSHHGLIFHQHLFGRNIKKNNKKIRNKIHKKSPSTSILISRKKNFIFDRKYIPSKAPPV